MVGFCWVDEVLRRGLGLKGFAWTSSRQLCL